MNSTFDISSMDEQYRELSKLLNNCDDKIKIEIFDAYRYRHNELLEAETLIRNLERLGCKGLENKFKDITVNVFDSTVSELTVAEILLNNKYDVELLSENDLIFKKNKREKYKSPDIVCKKDTLTTYIEVVRLNGTGSKEIMDLVEGQIGDFVKDLPYRIDVYLSERLSIPKKELSEINEQKKLLLDSIETFKKSLNETIKISSLPCQKICTEDIIFEIKEIELEQGYIGIIYSDCFDIPTALIEYFEKHDIHKKNKAYGFLSQMRKNPFIIAIDLHMREIKYESIHRLLYGDVAVHPRWMKTSWEKLIAEIHERDSWKKIERAQSNGWASFLIEKFLIPDNDNFLYINREGIFVLDKMDDVSAVLLIDHNRKYFLYPNPFCRDEINNLKIVDLISI